MPTRTGRWRRYPDPAPDVFFRRACGKLGITLPQAIGLSRPSLCVADRLRTENQASHPRRGPAAPSDAMLPTDMRDEGEDEPVIGGWFVGARLAMREPGHVRRAELHHQEARRPRRSSHCRLRHGRDSTYATETISVQGHAARAYGRGSTTQPAQQSMVTALAIGAPALLTDAFPTSGTSRTRSYISHNGEINTLRGDQFDSRAREGCDRVKVLGQHPRVVFQQPVRAGRARSTTRSIAQSWAAIRWRHAIMTAGGRVAGNPLMDEGPPRVPANTSAALMEP